MPCFLYTDARDITGRRMFSVLKRSVAGRARTPRPQLAAALLVKTAQQREPPVTGGLCV